MAVLLRATNAGARQQPTIHRPPSQVSNDVLRVPASGRRVSQHSQAPSVASATQPPPVRRTVSAPVQNPEPENWRSWFRKAYKRFHLKNLLPLFVIMIYMLIGSVIFYWLESSNDDAIVSDNNRIYERERELLRRRVDEILNDRSARRSRTVRRKWIDEAVDHYQNKVGFEVRNTTQWDLMSAMYYSGTLFTTIGYGDIACVTTAGRILTVIYSCIGIPLMLITLNDLGKFLYNNINGCVKGVDNVYLGVIRVFTSKKQSLPEQIDLERGNDPTAEISSIASQIGSEHTDDTFELEEKPPRMSVKVALGITIGWILFCSSLFRLWENWSYGESLYFMYISLSTIGLGDISVERRDMMVLCFVFVMVGLSLVSMTINVVQVALEDFYISMMMKLIMEYQEKLATGGDQMGASVGMMRMWGNNKTAKYLMPLLSKEKKRMAMDRVEVEAKSQGFEIPEILNDLDTKTGMPKLLCMEETKEGEPASVELEQMVQKQVYLEETTFDPIYIAHDAGTQTETVCSSDEMEQTEETVCEEGGTQTEVETKEEGVVVETQTDGVTSTDVEAQTPRIETSEADTITVAPLLCEQQNQTEARSTMEEEVQTYIAEQIDAQNGTDIETKNIRIQTPCPIIEAKTIQTEDLEDRKSPSKMSVARRRWRRAFGGKPKQQRSLDPSPVMSEWRDVNEPDESNDVEGEEEVEDEGSIESLHWDRVDGMHAEKQLPVSRLAKMFERNASIDSGKKRPLGRKHSSFQKKRESSRTRKSSE